MRDGFGITVQHALLWNMGSEFLVNWGPERTRRVNPLDEWLAVGAKLAAGTDSVRPFNPMTNVWGMVTRGTKAAGIQGPEHAIGDLDIVQRAASSLEQRTAWARDLGAVDLARGFATALREELDLRVEARNLTTVTASAALHRPGDQVRLP